ncbi:aminotransferase class I/II-fold pyridoxal phosphate-dependent enzyme, partial [Candidatus Sumerlaeota bacterium]|nr:aminotransferase class I/II-fold pyridoxal phosphate-dependent enzyme [Candidatus Sumerlaeota bacterium]
MAVQYRKVLKTLRPYPPGKPIEEVQREYALEEVVKLASNENLYGPSRKAMQKIKQLLGKINYYPDANVYYLSRALARKLNVNPANLLFSNGTDEMILLIALTFFEPTDNIVISENAFIRYQMAAQVMGIAWKSVPMKEYHHDVRALLDVIDENTKAIFIDNPNNPLGTAIGKKEIEWLLDKTPEHTLVIIDEAYREFVQRPDYHFESTEYLSKYKNLVLLRTFSKVYGLAGLR